MRITTLSLGLCLLSAPALRSQEVGVVKSLAGTATVERQAAVTPVVVGDALFVGDTLATAAASSLGATMVDGAAIAIGPSSAARIDVYVFEPGEDRYDVRLMALKGRVLIRSGLIGEARPDRIVVETPRLVIGVRGTRFAILVPEQE